MKCEITNKEVCYLTTYKGLLVSISEICNGFDSKEDLEKLENVNKKEEKQNE